MKKYLFTVLIFCIFLLCCSKVGQSDKESLQNGNSLSQKVDIDITKMNLNLASAQIQNIELNPKQYIGKTIKIAGSYYYASYPDTHEHFVLLSDAASCCQYGFRFIRDGDYKYPKDYPPVLTKIELIGVIGSDEQGCYLSVDEFKSLK